MEKSGNGNGSDNGDGRKVRLTKRAAKYRKDRKKEEVILTAELEAYLEWLVNAPRDVCVRVIGRRYTGERLPNTLSINLTRRGFQSLDRLTALTTHTQKFVLGQVIEFQARCSAMERERIIGGFEAEGIYESIRRQKSDP